jgi:dTDP-4-dehydrorhamnose reductase
MELWGGVECTINRVADRWHSQLALSGHLNRIVDLDLIADLGIRTLRYPVLWEMTAAQSPKTYDWRWADSRLARLRSLGVEPIVGLLHHGSGPRYTSLVEDSFPPRLAEFAGQVAERFPWVERFTPVNEPLTTARFSGLYGLWYPHSRNERVFARALINQCRAVVLSMQAIRRSNPSAKLIQTEDLGTTYSTAHMQYQREFDNERRWLTWDLLCGRLDRTHPMHPYLLSWGIAPAEIDWFSDNPCPPEVVGINHYVTSDRYLDERIGQYAPQSAGRNSVERYADVEAVRVLSGEYRGFRVLREASERYGLPVALTEVHLGCSREEQLRWFYTAWLAAEEALTAGCDVRAVTSWALFGAFNWDTLLTRSGSYEPGAFDVRGKKPRPTAIAQMIRDLNGMKTRRHAAAQGLGWWQRSGKVLYGAAVGHSELSSKPN